MELETMSCGTDCRGCIFAGITGDHFQGRIGIGFANPFVFRLKKTISFLFSFESRPPPEPEFRFNTRAIFTRFRGENSWDTWERDGTIVVKNLAGYLEDELDVDGIYRVRHVPASLQARSESCQYRVLVKHGS